MIQPLSHDEGGSPRGRAVSITGRRGQRRFVAECEDCSWQRDTGNLELDRKAAKLHAERNGHRVFCETSRSLVYDGRAAS